MSNSQQTNSNQNTQKLKRPGILKMIWSSLAMLVGVQSSKNYAEDFNTGIWHIVIVAFICALIFFFGIYGIVQIVMSNIE
jgi:hypothetical protein